MSKFVIEPHFRLQEWIADEKRYFTSADTPLVLTIKGVKFGAYICEDTWSAHAPARA